MKQLILISIIALLSIYSNAQQASKQYLIAYNVHIPDTAKDDWEILITDMDGKQTKNITNNDDVAWAYYAYKKRLFFISDRDTAYRNYFLYEMDADGNNIRKITDLRLEDSWICSRNNGGELIVAGRIGNQVRHQLFLVDTKTGDCKQLTTDTAAYYADPCFSPDGNQIVFSHKKNKRDKASHEELFIMNADGSGIRQLTHYPEDNPSAKEYGYKAGSPRWHPTENFITYISMQDGRHSIFAITPDGKKQWKLIDNPNAEGWHDWSTDGKWLVFNSSDNEEKQFHITLMNWTTKEQKQLTTAVYTAQQAPVFVEK